MYVLIVGGGKVGMHLASLLLRGGEQVKLIEQDWELIPILQRILPSEAVVSGNGTDPLVLERAGIRQANVVAAVTGDDEDNLIICQAAKRWFGVPRIIGRVNNPANEDTFRKLGIDLQKEVHEDMARAFADYPHKWGLKRPDSNIDHRRVPNLMTYFQLRGWAANSSTKAVHFSPGDVVAWDLGGGVTHIGLVSDRQTAETTPLVIHNIGSGTKEEDVLFRFKIIGHYRPVF